MSRFEHEFERHSCVAGVVRKIVKAQNKVAAEERENETCSVSCERSIDQLLSPRRNQGRGRKRNNTIPFVLFSKGKLKPFIGSGFKSTDGHFVCIESPVFRAKRFVDSDCVELELLLPVRRDRRDDERDRRGERKGCGDHKERREERGGRGEFHEEHNKRGGHEEHRDHHHRHHHHCDRFLCDFFHGQRIRNFRATGVCITVDLDCFCAISCLEPIRLVRND